MSKPIKTLREGQVSLSIWQKDFDGKPTYSYSYQKSYKDKSGQWQNTTFLNKTDLKDLIFLAETIIQSGILKKAEVQKAPNQQQQVTQTFQGQQQDPYASDNNIPF